MIEELATRFTGGDVRALAQAISLVERRDERVGELLARVRDQAEPRTNAVGFTGAPGVGKSTLVDAMISAARGRGATIGVLAVDPSSPYSGGALLGDRLRMDAHVLDTGVYVRSMGARGQLGGLSATAGGAIWLLSAYGFDEVLVETVGTGQSEHEIPGLVDTTVVVLTPGMGDSVQAEKAGIMEIADVFALNKADLPGAETLARTVRTMLNLGPKDAWRPPIVPTVAIRPEATAPALWDAIRQHREHLATTDVGRARQAARLKDRAAAIVAERARVWARERLDDDEKLVSDGLPYLAADRLTGTVEWYDRRAMWDVPA